MTPYRFDALGLLTSAVAASVSVDEMLRPHPQGSIAGSAGLSTRTRSARFYQGVLCTLLFQLGNGSVEYAPLTPFASYLTAPVPSVAS